MRRRTYNARGNLFDSGNGRVWIDHATGHFFSHRPVEVTASSFPPSDRHPRPLGRERLSGFPRCVPVGELEYVRELLPSHVC
jgi:hypothetical protein